MLFRYQILCSLALFFMNAHTSVSADRVVQFSFYNRAGKKLQYSEVQKLSKGEGKGWENDALLDPLSLALIKANPLNRKLAFSVRRRAFFAMNWEVEPNGFILVIIDNNGDGIKGGEKINFTYQAALDMQRRLLDRMKVVKYKPSSTFSEVYEKAALHLDVARKSTSESEKGAEGYIGLDFLSVAYDIFLREYGMKNAGSSTVKASPQVAFTVDRLDDYRKMIDLVREMAGEFAWIRLYLDIKNPLSEYDDVIQYCHERHVKILAEPVDSSDAKSGAVKSCDGYLKRFKECVARWPEVDVWEVGNEVNGSWLPRDIDKKVISVVNYCHKQRKKTFLCFFWQLNTDKAPFDLFSWIKRIPEETREKVDYVGLSIYVDQAPMGADAMDMVMMRIEKEFPDSEIGIAELGYWIEGQRLWWAYDKNDPMGKALSKIADQYYRSSFAYERSYGGGYWWNFCTEFQEHKELRKIITDIRKELIKKSPFH